MTALDFPASPTDGQTFGNYIYNATRGVWSVQANVPGISSRYQVSATAPTTPQNGDMWFNSTDAVPYMYYVDGDGGQWIEVGGLNGSADPYLISDTPPTSEAVNGSLWFDTTTGNTFVYYTDTDSSQWVQISGQTLGGSIEDLSEVILTNASAGDALVFDGTNWVNSSVDVYDAATSSAGFFALPVGADSDRPVTPANGYIRFNTDSGEPEYYNADLATWFLFREEATLNFSVEYLIVAGGGGGGGRYHSGGGGAGGYRSNVSGENSGDGSAAEAPLALSLGTYSIEVGGGGTGGSGSTNGGNSNFNNIISLGGGGGGDYNEGGKYGGSGGGGNTLAGGNGTLNQGNDGGDQGGGSTFGAGGGGGAGEPGSTGTSAGGGAGGIGQASLITNSLVYYAGGGGGASYNTSLVALGGNGGGGNGAPQNGAPTNGVDNLGGGGGGSNGYGAVTQGGSGGSGVVILKVPSTVSASFSVGLTEDNGGAGQTVGDYKVYTVTAGTGTVTFA